MNFKIHKKPFLTLMGAGVASQFILLLISPLLTRLYTPEELGAYGIFIALCATMAGIAGGRLELAIPVAKAKQLATELLLLTILLAIPMSAFLGGLVIWAASALEFTLIPKGFAMWLPVAALAIVLFQAINYWLLWNKDYSGAAKARWTQGGAMATVQLVAGYLGSGAWGLIVGHTIAQFLGGVIGGGVTIVKEATLSVAQLSLKKLLALLQEHKSYPIVMAPAALLNMAGQHLPILLIGWVYGAKAAGFYAIAQRVCGAPLALVGQAIGQVFAAEAPQLLQGPLEKVRPAFARLIKYMLFGGGLFVVLLGMFAPDTVAVVFGEEWRGAGVLMQILSLVFVLEFVVTPVSLTLSFLGDHGRQLWWDAVRLLSILVTFALAVQFDLSLYEAMIALAFALSCCHLYLLLLMWRSLGCRD
jgi:O-antigen/teichoic acid export membrane protein